MRASAPELALLIVAAVACKPTVFSCDDDDQCRKSGIVGVCQPEGVCSFPDMVCESGQRYGDHSGELSGRCVPSSGTETSGSSTTTSGVETIAETVDPSVAEVTSTVASTMASTADSGPGSSEGVGTSSTGDDPDPSLLIWLTFDDDPSDGFTNDGALGGVATCSGDTCPLAVAGAIGSAARFDGVDDCGRFEFQPQLAPDTFTLAMWARRETSGAGFDVAFTKPVGDLPYNTWRMTLQYDDLLGDRLNVHVGMIDDSGVDSYAALPLGTWVHFAATWSGDALISYVDGALIEVIPSTLIEVDDQPVLVGCDDDHMLPDPVNYLEGAIDDVRMYDRVLDLAEIAELHALGSP